MLYPTDELPDKEPGTPASRDILWQRVQEDRRRGHVIADSCFYLGISSIAYPLYNHEGAVEGVVSIMVPVHEFPTEALAGYRPRLRKRRRAFPVCWVIGKPLRTPCWLRRPSAPAAIR